MPRPSTFGRTLDPSNWIDVILADQGEPRMNYYLPPGRYAAADYVNIAGRGMIGIFGEPGVTMDAQFRLEGVGEITFEDIEFKWTPRSGDHYKFQTTSTTAIFRNCQGSSVAEGGFFAGGALTALTLDTANSGHDSEWDFSHARLPLYLIDQDNGSYTYFRGGSHPGTDYCDRIVLRVSDSEDDAAIHLGAGGGHLVNMRLIGQGRERTAVGLRLARGWTGDIVAYPCAPGMESGIGGFRYGLDAMGCLVQIHGEGAPFVIRDCEFGIEVDAAVVFVSEATTTFPDTTTPIRRHKEYLRPSP